MNVRKMNRGLRPDVTMVVIVAIAAAVVMVAAPCLAFAQTVTVLPGDATIDGSKGNPITAVYSLTVSANGVKMDAGTMTSVSARVVSNGREVWRVAHSVVSDGGNTTDTIIADLKSIAPISVRGATPAGTLTLDYAGTKITGEHRDPEGSAQAIVQTLSQPAFDPNGIDLLLTALPLRAGYDVRVPMFTNESGMVWYNIKVDGDATGASVPAWNVTVKTPDGMYRYTLDKADQSTIGYVFDDGNRMQITMKLQSRTGRNQ